MSTNDKQQRNADTTPQERNTPAGKEQSAARNFPDESRAPHEGVHTAHGTEQVKSRSADPGQSSYGGFRNEDPRYQAQQTENPAQKGKEIDGVISGNDK